MNNTPNESISLKWLPDKAKSALTQAEYNEVIEAQKKAAHEKANARLAVLQTEISGPTQKKLEDNGVKLADLTEEAGFMEKASEIASGAVDSLKKTWEQTKENFSGDGASQTVTEAVRSVPVVGAAAVATTQAATDKVSAWKQFVENPWEFFAKLGEAIKQIFTEFKFDKISELFGFGQNIREEIRKWIEALDSSFLDISNAIKSQWTDLLLDVNGFRDLTLEKLRSAENEADIAKFLGISADNEVLQNFVKQFFGDKEKFLKMSEVVEQKTGAKIDEKTMKIGDFITKLA